MMPLKRVLVPFPILAVVMLACGVTVDLGITPSATPTKQLSALEQIATAVEGTVRALTQAAPSATPTSANTSTPTKTPLPPLLSVSTPTNCYGGPSTNYGFVITIYPGTSVTVVGQDTADNYWIIDVPNYPGTVCWLSGQYASLSGETSNLPAPATPVISVYALSEPRRLRVTCTSEDLSDSTASSWRGESEWTVVLRWTNTDPDQTGVRVYRNGWRIATLRGHATSYTDSFIHYRHHDVTYGVQASNRTSVSSIVTIDVNHCD